MRLVAPRRDDGVLADMSSGTPSAPALVGLRCVFGVGDPEAGAFCPVYTVGLPVAQPGALDEDGAHEFAAADLLADLQRRATRRAWAVRVEVDVAQTAFDAAGSDLYAEGPDGAVLQWIAEAALPGGGRKLTLGTGLAHTPEAAVRLAGPYVVRHEADRACSFELGLTEYEFEG